MISPLVENGVMQFMKKLNTGYANYFNKKYNRKGALFEGRYKSIIITNESHFTHLPFYIHCNPLDLIDNAWREYKISNFDKAVKFLNNYRWSTHLDYLGKSNFPSVSQRNFLLEVFGGTNSYKDIFIQWLKDRVRKPFEVNKIIALE